MSPAGPSIRVVLPTYNEADNLEPLVAAVLGAAPAGTGLLVVDDASPDGTGEIADRLGALDPRVSVLHRPTKEGLGPAYVAGFQRVLAEGADLVVQMDADFSHDPGDVPRLIAAAADADLVIGSRYVSGGGVGDWGLARKAISRWGSTYARAWLGLGICDLTGGFKCYRREVLERIQLETVGALGYAFQVETTYRTTLIGAR
ncbi:MAG: polyprenol monophosphomannose synthase, partial [Solirubrobacterales bacterium]|nr:polyprenol monophosphomannose synthase [Solirubrobacterales bacterium]